MARVTAPRVSLLHLHQSDIPGEDQGPFRHRLVNAVSALGREPEFNVAMMAWDARETAARAIEADIVVLHGLGAIEVESLIEQRRALGRATLYEIADDLTAATPWRRRGPSTRNVFHVGRQLRHAALADGVQCSSEGLRARYAALAPRTAVLDNLVAFPVAPPAKSSGFVFGWAGTRSHAQDLAAIVPAIEAFCRRHGDATFALMGDAELHALFAGIAPSQRRFSTFGPYDDYRAFLDALHVGVIPLGDSQFNRGRSDVKLIEMAAAGVAVLAQDAPVYRPSADVARLFRTVADVESALEHLYRHRELIAQEGALAFDTLRIRRGDAAVRAAHVAWYRRFIGPSAEVTRTRPEVPDFDYFAMEKERRRRLADGDARGASALQATLDLLTPERAATTKAPLRRYRAFGLSIESAILLAAVEDAASPEAPDLRIARGDFASLAGSATDAETIRISPALDIVALTDQHWVLSARGVDPRQQYAAHVRPGIIEIGWNTGVEEVDVAWNLQGIGMAAYAFVTSAACFHGSVVAAGGRTFAILGNSGAGKSTLTAALVASGARLVSEEIIVVGRDDALVVYPGIPQVKVSPEVAEQLGLSAQARQAIRHLSYAEMGVSIHLDLASQFRASPVRLDAIYVLTGRSGLDMRRSLPLGTAEAAAAVASFGYWMNHLPVAAKRVVLSAALQIARGAIVQHLTVPATIDGLKAQVATLFGGCDLQTGAKSDVAPGAIR